MGNEHGKAPSVRKVAKQFAIKPSTLFRYVQKLQMSEKEKYGAVSVGYAHQTVLNPQQESKLVMYLKTYANLKYGLTSTELRRFAYEYCVSNGLEVPRAWRSSQSPGVDWLRSFLKRHPDISIQRSGATREARRSTFNEHHEGVFFENYENILNRRDMPSSRIYCMDEVEVHTVLKPGKVVTATGVKQEEFVLSAGSGELVTVVVAASAVGSTLPPMFIFPREIDSDQRGPTGSIATGNESGCQTADTLLLFLKHFVKHTDSSKDNPALLFLDFHPSNISFAAIELTERNGVTLVTYPPNCPPRMQPSVFGPLKLHCTNRINAWLKTHPGESLTLNDLPAIMEEVFISSINHARIAAEFRKCGLLPYSKTIFPGDDFLDAFVTEHVAPDNHNLKPRRSIQAYPRTSTREDHNVDADNSVDTSPSSSSGFTPESDRSVPRQASTRARTKPKPAVLTGTRKKKVSGIEESPNMRMPVKIELDIPEEPREHTVPDFTAVYSEDNIFVAFETRLCYKALSSSGDCSEGVGVLLCFSMNGSFLKPLVVGNCARPKVFGNFDDVSLPVLWRPSPHACITDLLLEEWLNFFNESMAAEGREVVLFLSTQSCHSDSLFANVKIGRAPQTLDTSVIQYFKGLYRKSLLQTIVLKSCSEVEHHNVNVEASMVGKLCSSVSPLDTVSWISQAVSNIPPNLVRKSFVASGFVPLDGVVDPEDDAETSLRSEISDLCQRLNVDPEGVLRFEDECSGVPLLIKEEPVEPMQEEEEVDIRTYSEALKAVNALEKFAALKNCPQILIFLQGAKEALTQNCLDS